MPDDKPERIWHLTVTFDTQTGQTLFEFPPNLTVALGMIEMAREALLMTKVRPALAPSVMAAGAIPARMIRED